MRGVGGGVHLHPHLHLHLRRCRLGRWDGLDRRLPALDLEDRRLLHRRLAVDLVDHCLPDLLDLDLDLDQLDHRLPEMPASPPENHVTGEL